MSGRPGTSFAFYYVASLAKLSIHVVCRRDGTRGFVRAANRIGPPGPYLCSMFRHVLRGGAAGIAAVVGVGLALVFTAFNGSEAEAAWDWSREIFYLIVLGLWLAACVVFAWRGRVRGAAWTSATLVGFVSLAGWLLVLAYAISQPK